MESAFMESVVLFNTLLEMLPLHINETRYEQN